MRLPRLPPLTVRARATAVSVVVLVPVLALAGGTAALLQRHELTRDAGLVAADQARTLASAARTRDSDAPALPSSSAAGEPAVFQIVDGAGRVTASSPTLAGRAPLVGPPDAGTVTRIVAAVDPAEGDSSTVVAVPVSNRDLSRGYVVTALSLESVDTAVASTESLLLVGGPLLVLLVAVLTFLLTGRALAPVERMRARAATVSASDLSARLPVPVARDEISRLASTMNAMLDRIEAGVEAQRRFVADASHELRNPLATIRTLHEVALRLDDADPRLGAEVLLELDRLERLTSDLLASARGQSLVPLTRHRVDLAALVRREAARARRSEVRLALADAAVVDGDPDALRTVVGNLVDNADRHARSAISISLSAGNGPTAGSVVLEVADDGHGIPPAERERVFERFVRLDEARSRDTGGAGLGLAIARAAVTMHGGSITVEPGPGGARLRVVLPGGG